MSIHVIWENQYFQGKVQNWYMLEQEKANVVYNSVNTGFNIWLVFESHRKVFFLRNTVYRVVYEKSSITKKSCIKMYGTLFLLCSCLSNRYDAPCDVAICCDGDATYFLKTSGQTAFPTKAPTNKSHQLKISVIVFMWWHFVHLHVSLSLDSGILTLEALDCSMWTFVIVILSSVANPLSKPSYHKVSCSTLDSATLCSSFGFLFELFLSMVFIYITWLPFVTNLWIHWCACSSYDKNYKV